MTRNNPTQHVTVRHGFRVTVGGGRRDRLTARSADEALLRAALGLPRDDAPTEPPTVEPEE